MSPPSPKATAITHLVQRSPVLQRLWAHAQELSHLQSLVAPFLEPLMRTHCHLVAWHNGILLMLSSDGHWATRLRYQTPRLEHALKELPEFTDLTRIQIKVRPIAAHAAEHKRSVALSQTTAALIHSALSDVTDPKLRAALERLALHTKS